MMTNLLKTFTTFILITLCIPALPQALDKAKVDFPNIVPFNKTPPVIQWIEPVETDTVNSAKFSLMLELSHSYYSISKLRTRLNKQNWKEHKDPFSPEKDQEAKKAINAQLTGKNNYYKDTKMNKHQILLFSLQEGKNEIEVSVTNQGQISTDTTFTVFYTPATIQLPTLHLITVGVGFYKFDNIRPLTYPAKDAIAIDSIFIHQDRRYKGIKKYHLTNEKATKEAIVSLIAEVKKSVKKNDVIIAFFSGHGDKAYIQNIEEWEIRFMPHNFDNNDKENTGILNSYIIDEIETMQCNSFIIFDACHSGSLLMGGLASKSIRSSKKMETKIKQRQKKNQKELIVLNASEDEAFEHPKWKHGALTKALLEAFEGRIDEEFMPTDENAFRIMSKNGKLISSVQYLKKISKDGLVDAKELLIYTHHRVSELVNLQNGKQEPVFDGQGNFFLYQIHQ